jgi:hypothetical protein
MFSEILTPHLKYYLFLGNKLKCIHYAWNAKQNKIVPLSKNTTARFIILINVAYSLLQITTTIYRWKTTTAAEHTQAYFFVFVFVAVIFLRTEWGPSMSNVQLINVMCQGKL